MKRKLLSIFVFLLLGSLIISSACSDPEYYGTYYALNEDDKIVINENGFTFGGTAYNYEVNDTYYHLTNYSGNTTKFYRYENDNVISPNVTFNFDTGAIPTRNGPFDATLTALDGKLNATSVFYFTSYGEYQLIFPSAPTLSESGIYNLKNGLLTLTGNYKLSHQVSYKRYYIDTNYSMHVYAYVKDISKFDITNNAASPTEPNAPTETPAPSEITTTPITSTETENNYELTYGFDSDLNGYVVKGISGNYKDVVIPSTYKSVPVTSIGSSAFSGCSSLTSITIPDSVTSIGSYAFAYCSSLTSITIPNSVTSIGYAAFAYCDSLTSITIPNSITSIGQLAFRWCDKLIDIYYKGTIDEWVSKIDGLNELMLSSNKNLYINNSLIVSINITTANKINRSAFSHCSSLTSITIGNSVTSIGEYAFYGCSSLTSITIPNSVTSIGNTAFSGCSSLTSITIPDSVTGIGNTVFSNCSIKTIYLDSSYAFNYKTFADTLPEFATNVYVRTDLTPTLSVYTIVYEKQTETVIHDGKEYYHYKIKE